MSQPTYVLGNEFFVYDASSNAIAYATDCTLSVSAETIDTSNKQSGVWASAIAGQMSWTVSTSALYTSEAKYDELFTAMTTRTPITIKFGRITSLVDTSTGEIDTTLNTSAGYYEGQAYINSLELSAGNNEVASYTAEFTGNGKLEHKNA